MALTPPTMLVVALAPRYITSSGRWTELKTQLAENEKGASLPLYLLSTDWETKEAKENSSYKYLKEILANIKNPIFMLHLDARHSLIFPAIITLGYHPSVLPEFSCFSFVVLDSTYKLNMSFSVQFISLSIMPSNSIYFVADGWLYIVENISLYVYIFATYM